MKIEKKLDLTILTVIGIVVIFIVGYFISIKGVVTGDEFINISRTLKGYVPANIIDYSLRPFFRILNMMWVELFGSNMDALIYGNSILFIIMLSTFMLYFYKLTQSISLVILAISVLLISPELIRIGLNALPQMPAGLFSLLAVILMMEKVKALTENRSNTYALSLAMYTFSILAFYSHPAQIAILFLVVLIDFLVTLLSYINYRQIFKVYRNSLIINVFYLIVVIVSVEILYLSYGNGLQKYSPALSISDPYSHLLIYYNSIFNDPSNPKMYHHPWGFYFDYLFSKHSLFTVTFFALMMLVVRRIYKCILTRGYCNDKLYLTIPMLFGTAFLLIISLKAYKASYTVTQIAPIMSLAIISSIVYLSLRVRLFIAILFFMVSIINIYIYIENSYRHPTSYAYDFVKKSNFTTMAQIKNDNHKYRRQCNFIVKSLDLKSVYIENLSDNLIGRNTAVCVPNNKNSTNSKYRKDIIKRFNLSRLADGHGIEIYGK